MSRGGCGDCGIGRHTWRHAGSGGTVDAGAPEPRSDGWLGRTRAASGGQPGVPPLRRPRGHALGKGEWRATIPLQKLRADLQRSDENAHLRKKDKWLEQAGALIDGASVAKAAERCDVAYTTAFRWRHRFLEALSQPKNLAGIVEGDETFILESFKGKRSGIPRASRKR